MKVVYRGERGDMEAHPLEDISGMLVGKNLPVSYLRFSVDGSAFSSRISVPITFIASTVG